MNQIVLGAIVNNIAGFVGCIAAYCVIKMFEHVKYKLSTSRENLLVGSIYNEI